MKYAAVKSKIIDFDISKGNSYEETIKWFNTEAQLMAHANKNPENQLIRYETVQIKLVGASDLV